MLKMGFVIGGFGLVGFRCLLLFSWPVQVPSLASLQRSAGVPCSKTGWQIQGCQHREPPRAKVPTHTESCSDCDPRMFRDTVQSFLQWERRL